MSDERGRSAKRRGRSAEERLDDLYREHPDGFVAGRDQLARDLREAGDRGEAERVKKLRRPTVAAWVVNRAALASPVEMGEFAAASGALEAAEARVLAGDAEGADAYRSAAERERAAARPGEADLASQGRKIRLTSGALGG